MGYGATSRWAPISTVWKMIQGGKISPPISDRLSIKRNLCGSLLLSVINGEICGWAELFRLRCNVFSKFDVPVGEINEMLPTVVAVEREIDLHKRTPFGPLGLAHQVQAGLVGCPVCLVRVARDAGAHDVFPGRWAAAVAGNDVVEVQIFPLENFAAILAGVLVALKNVVPGELYFLLRHPVIHEEQDDFRHTDAERNRVDGVVGRRVDGDVREGGDDIKVGEDGAELLEDGAEGCWRR